jgi:hypothetical protein
MAKAIKEIKKRVKKIVNRKGIVAKTKSSNNKGSKLYKKKYRGQGR